MVTWYGEVGKAWSKVQCSCAMEFTTGPLQQSPSLYRDKRSLTLLARYTQICIHAGRFLDVQEVSICSFNFLAVLMSVTPVWKIAHLLNYYAKSIQWVNALQLEHGSYGKLQRGKV